jgi:hypothetical protein
MFILDKFNEIRREHYRKLMDEMYRESHMASNEGDLGRSVMLYNKYLQYKHKYIKAGGKA